MPGIRLTNLVKTYRVGRQATGGVNRVNLDVPDGKIVTLLGPSGCGKSTTLRCIAGLERPDDGDILFDQRVVFSRRRRINVPSERRNVGMVFQSYAIWPHLTVFENVRVAASKTAIWLLRAQLMKARPFANTTSAGSSFT